MACVRHKLMTKTWFSEGAFHMQEICVRCGASSMATAVQDTEISAWLEEFLVEAEGDKVAREGAAAKSAPL